MTPEERIASTIDALCAKIEESLTMGRPEDVVRYSDSLNEASAAYRNVVEAQPAESEEAD